MLPIILAIKDKDDQNYVADIYERYKAKLFVIADRIVKNDSDSYDCIQEVVIILIENLQEFRDWDENRQKCFLFKCCKNIAINKYNKNARQFENEIPMIDPETNNVIDIEDKDSNIQNIFINEETRKTILDALKNLPEQYADILIFKYYFGMKNKEIAKMLHLPIGTVNMRMSRAKEKMAERLGGVR